jgi:glycosyltransferase involved in cell wall biosynthesis
MKTHDPLQVAINIAVSAGATGGIFQSTAGLVQSLGRLEDGPEQYTLVARSADQAEWLQDYLGPNQRIVVRPAQGQAAGTGFTWTKALKLAMGPLMPIARRVQHLLSVPRQWPELPLSDGFLESLGCDVVHFPTQGYELCALPTIYNPHDLQHLHYPQFFTPYDLACRETIYRAACHFAATVAVGTQWIKDDVVRRYGTDPAKVQVIPWASPTQFYRDAAADHLTAVLRRYQLERPFALYPAVCWPHKNHLRLLEALAHLRNAEGRTIRLVCTGSKYEPHWPKIESCLRELNLQSQVKFLGFVPEEDLRSLYRLAQFLVMPTLYEADSCPIHEAWSEGLPVASSSATALPDQVLDAGLLFDPMEVPAIADALARMSSDGELRDELREKGRRRVKDFDWQRTAKAYRAVYRRAAGRTLTDEDRWLLSWDWMRDPERPVAALR